MTPFAAAFLLGLVSALGFAPVGAWPATIICFALWAFLLGAARDVRGALKLGWAFGVGHFLIGLNWIAEAFTYQAAMPGWLGWVAVLLLSLFLAIYPAIAAGIAWRYGRGGGHRFALMLGAAWTFGEWLRATLFTGFAWNPVAAIWAGTPIAFPARLIGTYGLSGLTVAAAAMLWPLGMMLRAAGKGRKLPPGRFATTLAPYAIAFALILSLRGPPLPADPRAPLLHIVQPNIGQEDKWDEASAPRNYARLAGLTGEPGTLPRLILWPEVAVPDFLEEDALARIRIADLMGPRDLLLTGAQSLHYAPDGTILSAGNSAFGMTSGARLIGKYDKSHLVPFGEYLPMRPVLSALGLSRLAPGDIDFRPGPGARSFALPGIGLVGTQICYEIIFSGHVVDPDRRPRFLYNPSNDAWFGRFGPPQHLAQAQLRAVEEGLPIVRATPTGISAVIDADGEVMASLPWHEAGAIDARLPPARKPTPFSQGHNWLALGFAALMAALAIATGRRAR
ncbi:apolipoprotein N-acyltransferase [Sphingomonas naphthae]|uniref:Apolipoprotein N-acyltransferase n=1 Tax=Sphingomonas naphthae TaxID=1813468 RepID=A0ABY7TI96_9SPHN|nr:apolipoprotein N-acyltransferase [Sphingomonas naphthae]WCT72890.1 apolipoprotein N-acyltransferase [Sphingomonas naphthae]